MKSAPLIVKSVNIMAQSTVPIESVHLCEITVIINLVQTVKLRLHQGWVTCPELPRQWEAEPEFIPKEKVSKTCALSGMDTQSRVWQKAWRDTSCRLRWWNCPSGHHQGRSMERRRSGEPGIQTGAGNSRDSSKTIASCVSLRGSDCD